MKARGARRDAAGALVTAAEIDFEHDSASLGNKMMWLPVALGPLPVTKSGRWHGLPADHVWSLWTRYACMALYAHPFAWDEIGFPAEDPIREGA